MFLLFYSAGFTLRGLTKKVLLHTCNTVLVSAVPQIHLSKWTDAERYELLQVLGSLFLPMDFRQEEASFCCGLDDS
jgi:hypothetical protein